MRKESVENMFEQIKTVKIQVAAQKLEGETGLAEAALRAPHAQEPGMMTRLLPWSVRMMKERLRILHQERELQAAVVRKM